MKNEHVKSAIWRTIAVIMIASLVLLSTVSASGLASPAEKGGNGKHNVTLAPVAPPQIKTHPLHPNNGKNTPQAPSMSAPMMTTTTPLAATAAPTQVNSPRNMKVLVISPIAEQYFSTESYDTRYRLQAIKAFLDQLGIPFDVYVANSGGVHNPLPALWDGVGKGYYQGIILEVGSQWVYAGSKNFVPFLTSQEWQALWDYEVMFGVRELVMYLAPNSGNAESYGLTYVGEGYLNTSTPATLTDAGKVIYPYLNAANPVPFINTYYYQSVVDPASPATPLLVDPSGSPVVSTHTATDGHETLAITADYTGYLISSLALSYGSINWLTKGVFLGERHAYLAPQVDDLLIDDNVWDPVAMTDTNDALTFRMGSSDLLATQAWQNNKSPANTCITLQPASQGKDSYIAADKTSNNFGNNPSIYTRSPNKRYSDERSLIQFDLSAIPQNMVITSAIFRLYQMKNTGTSSTVQIYPVTKAWVEGSGGMRKGVNWSTTDGTTPWSKPGGDYLSTLAGVFTADSVGWKQVGLTTLVQGWRADPSTNNGMILLSPTNTGTTNNEKAYYSSDYTTASLRPQLVVCNGSTIKLEFGFNGEGASGIYNPDTLTPAVIQNQASFRWINHTYSHINLDTISAAVTNTELTRNESMAINQLKLTFYSRAPFIQPDISGLYNATFQAAAYTFGVRYLISDTSRAEWNNPSPNAGIFSTLQPGMLIIPRHPSNLFYNLTTPDEWVSEYNCYYGPVAYPQCANGQWRYWDHNLTYTEILDKESDMMLQYLLKGDIDPLMFHQANLKAFDGTNTLLSQLVDTTLAKYSALFNLPIRNLGQADIGAKMADRMTYNASGVTGTYTPCQNITLSVSSAAKVPLTGAKYGTAQESYGGQDISYVNVAAGTPVTIPMTCQ